MFTNIGKFSLHTHWRYCQRFLSSTHRSTYVNYLDFRLVFCPFELYYKPLSRQGEPCFLNSEMPKKIHARPSINKSTERHPRVHNYSPLDPPLFPTIAACIITWTRKQGKGCAESCAVRFFTLKEQVVHSHPVRVICKNVWVTEQPKVKHIKTLKKLLSSKKCSLNRELWPQVPMYEYKWEKILENKINRDNKGCKDGENLREAVLKGSSLS